MCCGTATVAVSPSPKSQNELVTGPLERFWNWTVSGAGPAVGEPAKAAVGSQANVGGAASAPVVAAAFHPSLAPVGVLLAVLGYTVGTYAAWFCAQVMRIATTG